MRKQVYDLTLSDLELSPIWEYASDEEGIEGQDEATVRPASPSILDDALAGQFVAAARFTLADGTRMYGYLSPGSFGSCDLGSIQPAIVTDNGQVSFWFGCLEPPRTYIESSYAVLGKSADEIFPLSFALDAASNIYEAAGIVQGFMVMEDWDSSDIKIVR
ncbi:hypothetical protein GTP45_20355 [Pseudoduganella sp. FT55W]|uniref:Uncharacterized protein n=1 Tax=Duganella rivi TaxID=2666083 RepID=A0A7X4KDN2_9BURK|nr:hypothetical protein [Duganella rivi]MYM69172.1 hypothetical protein [Duganella rivi]